MPVLWTDAVLNAQADGSFVRPDELRVHTGDPGAAGTDALITDSDVVLVWSDAGVEGPLGGSLQPASAGRSYAAPSVILSSDTGDSPWLSFWGSGVFMGRVQAPQGVPAGPYQPNLALVA